MIHFPRTITITVFLFTLFLASCTKTQTQDAKTLLSVTEFSEKLKTVEQAQLVDVRTPDEYMGGHLANAVNIDYRNSNFQEQVSKLDKSKPVFVYCLSGGRSASAAQFMRSSGFSEVYEMDGGMISWRNAGLPESTNVNEAQSSGMSLKEFQNKVAANNIVLVDFYAEWCKPCLKMKPFLEEIEKDPNSGITIVRIDADANAGLLKELNISGIPYFKLFKKGEEKWNHMGFIDKENLLSSIKTAVQ